MRITRELNERPVTGRKSIGWLFLLSWLVLVDGRALTACTATLDRPIRNEEIEFPYMFRWSSAGCGGQQSIHAMGFSTVPNPSPDQIVPFIPCSFQEYPCSGATLHFMGGGQQGWGGIVTFLESVAPEPEMDTYYWAVGELGLLQVNSFVAATEWRPFIVPCSACEDEAATVVGRLLQRVTGRADRNGDAIFDAADVLKKSNANPKLTIGGTHSRHPNASSFGFASAVEELRGTLRDNDGKEECGENDDVCLDVNWSISPAANTVFPDQSGEAFPSAERYDFTQPKYNNITNNTDSGALLNASFANIKVVSSGVHGGSAINGLARRGRVRLAVLVSER